jgi:hypothetical protein
VPEIRLAGKSVVNYPAVTLTCQTYPSMPKRCPNVDARKITRLEHEDAGQIARDIAKTKQHEASMKRRKKVERLFAHLKRILDLGVFDCAAQTAQTTNCCSRQPPKTSANRPRSFLRRHKHRKPDRKGT